MTPFRPAKFLAPSNLVVLSDLFPFCADCYYSLETTQNLRSLQLLGLRGTLGTANTVLVESVSQKKN
jgi:hypothetical protein